MKISLILAAAGLVSLGLIWLGFSYAYPKITLFNENKVARNFARMPDIFPSNLIVRSANPRPFETTLRKLPETLHFAEADRALSEFLALTKTTSLLIIKDGVIISESTMQGYDETSHPTSFSVAKSYVSTMIGIALEQGLITSLDDEVTLYLPELEGSGFDGARIVDLLQMSSGIDFSEEYDDNTTDAFTIFDKIFVWFRSIDQLSGSYGSNETPGTTFHYASLNSHVLSLVIRRVSGQSLSTFMQQNIWGPLGAEQDAHWLTDKHSNEIGFWGLCAHPRDFARLGQLMLADGVVDGKRLLPEGWVEMATRPDKPYLQAGQIHDDWGYQYQWWVARDGNGQDFSAIGIWGQFIYVDPVRNLVIVKTSSDADFKAHEFQTIQLFRALGAWLDGEA